MALQTPNLTMVGLGIAQDRPPNNIQPPLVDGVHLRWAFPSERGFPWYGFYLYRRPHRAGTPTLLSSALGNLHPGPLPFNFLNTPYGQLSSDQNLVLTDDFPPTGQVELDLDHRAYTRITFPSDQLMRSIQSTIGLRARAGDPPATRTVIDFSNRAAGSGPNPDTEQGVSFNAFDANGKSLPVSHILSVPGTGTQVTGFDCQWNVNVTLPTPATFVQLTLTPLVKSVSIEAFNADGSSAGSATTMIPYGRTPETLTITGQAITLVVIQPHSDSTNNAHGADLTAIGKGNSDDSGSHSLLNQFCFGTGRLVAIEATAYAGTTPVAQTQIWGQAGQVISSSLEFEGISEVEFSSDTAALIDLGFVPLTQEATVGWTQMPDFTYPLRLPVTQPDYPCTPGAAENLEAARSLARQRVVYGDPGQFTAPPTQITNAGTITLVQGSSIVIGSGTAWGATIANAMLQVKGDLTAYAVIQVISPTKLVLSRAYQGASATNVAYALNNDNFAQYHDHLIQLVSGGSAAGSMGSRVLPAPIKTSGSVSVTQNATNVVGSGTQWDASLVGLSIEMAGDQVPYTIVSISSPTQLTLDRAYAGSTLGGQPYQINARISGQQDSAVSGTPPALAPQRIIDTVLLSTLQPAIAQMTGIYWVDQKATPATAFDYLLVADYSGVGGLNPANVLARLQQDNFATLEGCIVFNKQIAPVVPLQSPGDLRLYALPGNSRLAADGTNQDASNNVGLRWDLSVTDQGNLLPGRAIMYHLWRASLGNGTAPTVPGSYTAITQNQPVLVSGNLNSAVQISPAWPPFRMYYVDPALADGWYSYEVSGIDIFGRHSPNSGPGPWYEWIPVPDPRPRYYKDPPGNSIVNPSAVQLLSERVPPAPTGIEAYALDPQDPTLLRDSAYNAWFATLSSAEKQSLVGLRVRWSWTQAQMQQAPDTSEFRIYYHSGRMNVLPTTISNISFVPGSDGAESFVQTDITTVPAVDAYAGAWLRSGSDSFAILGNDASSPLHLRVRNIGSSSATGTVTVTAGSTTVTGQGTNWTIGLTGRTLQLAGDATHYLVANIVSSTQLTLQQPYSGTGSTNRAYTIFDSVPQNDASASLTLPPVYAVGSVTLVNGSSTVTGNETNWNPTLVGMPFQVGGDSEIYTIVSIDSATQLRLSRSYTAPGASNKLYAIRFPLFVDYGASINWDQRYYVVDFNSHVTVTTDDQGQSLRNYEILLPVQGDTFREDVLPLPTLANSILYANIGVSAADNRTTTPDNPRWSSGRWGNRPGNEGRVTPPATIFRVFRGPLPVPVLPAPLNPEHSTTSQADAQGHSFYTYRWNPLAILKAHIYRGLDETLFQVDWAQQPRTPLSVSQTQFFPNPTIEPRWTPALIQQIVNELNHLNSFTHDAAGTTQAFSYYRTLSNDALRVLAGLPGNEAAFSQLTNEPLDPADPANADRVGPDTPSSYTPNPNLRAFIDTLNGLVDNRYVYRALYVDSVHNRSGLSLGSVPVLIPDVIAPNTPVITKVLGGDRQISLSWASNRESDLKEYRVYRANDPITANNLGSMTLVHTEPVSAGDPINRPADVVWTDTPVAGLTTLYYRLVAADDTGNVSGATSVVQGRAFDDSHPEPPTWNSPVPGPQPGELVLSWVSPIANLACLVQRSPTGAGAWSNLSRWLSRGTYTFTDTSRTPGNTYDYRLLVLDSSGHQNIAFKIVTK